MCWNVYVTCAFVPTSKRGKMPEISYIYIYILEVRYYSLTDSLCCYKNYLYIRSMHLMVASQPQIMNYFISIDIIYH